MLHRILVSFAILGLALGCGSDAPTPEVTPPDPDAGAVDVTDDSGTPDVSTDTGADTTEPDAEPDVPETDTLPPRPGAVARIVHVSPDTPTLDIWIDGEAPGAGSPFAGLEPYEVTPDVDALEPYIQFEDRQYVFDLVPEGGTLEDSLLETRWNMTSGAIYTMWIGGLSGHDGEIPEGHEELILTGAVDDLGEPVDTETGDPRQRVRFFHSVIGAGNLDFTISGDKVDEALQFTWYSFDEHLVPLGEFTFGFSLAGDPEPLLAVPMEFGQWTTNVWAGGRFDQGEFWFVTLGPDNSIERRLEIIPEFFDVRFLHASPMAEAGYPDGVDIYRGSDQLATGAKYTELSDYAEVEAGRHRFAAHPFGSDPEVIEPIAEMGNRTYDAETSNTVVFFDDGSAGDASLVADDPEAPADGVVFLNAGALLGDATFDGLTGALALGDVSDPVSVPAGATQFSLLVGEDIWLFETTLPDSPGTIVVLSNADSATGGTAPMLLIVDAAGNVTTVTPAT